MEVTAVVSREVLEGLVSDYERALRAVSGEKGLPEAWEERLRSISRDTPMGLLKTFKWLAIYSELHHERREKRREVDAVAAQDAARAILRREPVRVELGGRVVEVTSRSYAAMAEIAAHASQIRLLEEDLHRVAVLQSECLETMDGARRGRGGLRRRLASLTDIELRLQSEILAHRCAIYAHALTPSGAPARSLEEAPSWWREIDPRWDAALLLGLFEVGVGRYQKLGPVPEPERERRGNAAPEDFGWGSLFASVERQQKLEPAVLFDRDLYQVLTWLRAGAPPPVEVD